MKFLLFFGYVRHAVISLFFVLILPIVLALGISITPGLGKILYDKLFVTFDSHLLIWFLGIQVFLIIYLSIFTTLQSFFEKNLSLTIANNIKIRYQSLLLRSKISFLQKYDTGYFVKRVIEDSDLAAEGISKTISIISNLLMISILAGILYFIEKWLFSLYSVMLISSLAWLALWVFPIHKFNQNIGTGYSSLYKQCWEMFQGIREIKLQRINNVVISDLKHTNNKIKNSLVIHTIFNTCMWQYATIFNTFGYIVILVVGLNKIESGHLSVGILLGILSLVFFILQPVQKIYDAISVVQNGITAVSRLCTLKKFKPEVSDKYLLTNFRQNIIFNNVSFSYGSAQNTLSNINFVIPRGHKIAIVGPSGSGKTTLCEILLKLYSSFTGTISIDGVPLQDYDTQSLREKMVIISQEHQILNDSIRNNIDLSRKCDDAKINQIVLDVNLANFISELENGIDTLIGEGGVSISGGEKQRIAIARCLAQNPEIVILDEITASLDPYNEDIIMKNILKIFSNKTIISISHKKSIIKNFDTIYVLKNGQIVEQGTYNYLLNFQGEFCRNFVTSKF